MSRELQNPNSIPVARWISGSRLYGTHTPSSDLDFNGIFRETLDDIILGRDVKTYTYSTSKPNEPNSPNDFDETLRELRQFVSDAMAGKSYAIEGLFVPDELVSFSGPIYPFLRENRKQLIGSLEPLVGYCRAQAADYSLKGERLETLHKAAATMLMTKPDCRLYDIDYVLPMNDYATIVQHPNGKVGELAPHYLINGMLFALNLKVGYVLPKIENKIKQYGKRANEAKEKGYDGKAYASAIRIAQEYISLVETGELKFPLENADFLRKVKLGEIATDVVQEVLDKQLVAVEKLGVTELHKPDVEFWNDWLIRQYK